MCVNCNEKEEKSILGTCIVFNCVYVNLEFIHDIQYVYSCIRKSLIPLTNV